MPMYWTFNCFIGCIYTVYHIVYIVFFSSKLTFKSWILTSEKRGPSCPNWGHGRGGLGDSGNARKKTFFSIDVFPNLKNILFSMRKCFFFSFWPQRYHTIQSIYFALVVLWCPIHLFYFAKNRDVQASSRIAGKSHGYQPARCKLVLERNQPGPWVHEVLLDHQLVAVGIVFPTSHLQPTHLATWDFDAGMISQFFSPQVQVCGREEARVRYWHRDKRWIFTSFGVLLIYIED